MENPGYYIIYFNNISYTRPLRGGPTLNKPDYDELRELAVSLAEDAVEFLRDSWGTSETTERVHGETFRPDLRAEEIIFTGLKKRGFQGLVVSEEAGVKRLGSGNLIAVIDPLDGTINYVNGIPWCAVSIAFIEVPDSTIEAPTTDNTVAGVVYPVFWGMPISFAKGSGVFIGGKKVDKSYFDNNYRELGEKIIAVYEDEPQAIDYIKKVYYALLDRLSNKYNSNASIKVRSLGSSALELAFVGIGKFGYFVDLRARLRIVDVAAGLGIIREAGGFYGDSQGRPLTLRADTMSRVKSIIAVRKREDYEFIVNSLQGDES